MTFQIVTLGDLVADLVVPLPRLPIIAQQHQIAHDIMLEAGGTGNILIMAARLGMQATPLAAAGSDIFGETIVAALKSEGVDVSHVVTAPHSTTTVSIGLLDDTGRHVFVWRPASGPQQQFDPAWRSVIAASDAVFTSGYDLMPSSQFAVPAVMVGFEVAREFGKPTFFDLGPSVVNLAREPIAAVLALTTVFLATQDELEAWSGIADPSLAAHSILDQGPTMVVVKLGADGCLLVTNDQQVAVAGFPVDVRNTAGAGDAFSAACMYSYLSHAPLEELGLLGNAVGAATVATIGTGRSLPQRQEIVRLLVDHGHTFFTGE